MSVVLSTSLSNAPNKHHPERNKTSDVVRRSVNYVPEIWGDRFVASSADKLKPDAQTQQRANELKEEVRNILRNVDDHLQQLNLIDAVQRLGVAYHFEEEIAQALLRMYKSGRDYGSDLHAVALQFRHLRQEGYNVSAGGGRVGIFLQSYHIRDRVVEGYFWTLGVYFEPQYSQARKMLTKIISLTSIMDDIYDVHGTLEELKPYTDAIQRWDRSVIDQFPDYLKLHFSALLDTVDKFQEELAQEGKSYRIPYLKQVFKELSKGYLIEEQWSNSGYVPTLEEYMTNGLISSAYPMLSVVSYASMGDVATKEAFDWGVSMPNLIKAASVISRLKNDIKSNQHEQERRHVASIIQIYINENGSTYEEACEKFKRMVADAWKDINKECLKPTPAPMPLLMRIVNLTRVIEMIYQHRDGYTNPTYETKEHILSVLVNPIPV